MKSLSPPHSAIFFVAALAENSEIYATGCEFLTTYFGTPVLSMGPQPFDHTAYYEPEMGTGLVKGFLAFAPPFHEGDLKRKKLLTREIEWRFASVTPNGVKRKLNLDPGFVTLSKTVLGTGKNFSHRIYLGEGVFAEVTLIFHPDGWEALPWTFPDYTLSNVQDFLTECRQMLKHYLQSSP